MIANALYHFGIFLVAALIVLGGMLVIDMVRKTKRLKRERDNQAEVEDPSKRRLKRHQESNDHYRENEDEIKARIKREDAMDYDWAMSNPDDPVAKRHLEELRAELVKEAGFLARHRVPLPFGAITSQDAYREQGLADLANIEQQIAEIDEVLPRAEKSDG